MSVLDQVTKGKIKKPHRIFLWGNSGVGKSSWAAGAPNPIFVGAEDGTNHLDVARFPEPKTYADIRKYLGALLTDKHEYKSVVVDSFDWCEPFIDQAVCDIDGSTHIDKALGGYGRGQAESLKFVKTLFSDCNLLLEKRGMNIIFIGHSQIKPFSAPDQPAPYDRIIPKGNEKKVALLVEYCDVVMYATYETFLKTDKDPKKVRALGDGVRVCFTEFRPAFIAKNRLDLPFQLPLSYEEFSKAVEVGKPESLESVLSSIKSLSALITDAGLKKKVTESVEKADDDVVALEKILNRLRVITDQK